MPIVLKINNGKPELISGAEALPEGEAVRLYTETELRRRMGLVVPKTTPDSDPQAGTAPVSFTD